MDEKHLLRTIAGNTWVDNVAHRLHHNGSCRPCDRDVEALAVWQKHALLLSSDTDCLSLWDEDGVIRTSRIGVYPQDMAIADDTAYVCGGADGRLHLTSLPDLTVLRSISLPGMPERITLDDQTAYVLTLLTDPEVQTALLSVDLVRDAYQEIRRFSGLPGAIHADESGLWVASGNHLMHLIRNHMQADCIITGFGLIRRLLPLGSGVVAIDQLEEQAAWVTAMPAPTIVPLPCCAADLALLIP